jgi:hypothetical protein
LRGSGFVPHGSSPEIHWSHWKSPLEPPFVGSVHWVAGLLSSRVARNWVWVPPEITLPRRKSRPPALPTSPATHHGWPENRTSRRSGLPHGISLSVSSLCLSTLSIPRSLPHSLTVSQLTHSVKRRRKEEQRRSRKKKKEEQEEKNKQSWTAVHRGGIREKRKRKKKERKKDKGEKRENY